MPSCILPLLLLLSVTSLLDLNRALELLVPTHGFAGLPDALKLPSEKVNDSQPGFDSEI